MDNHTLSNTKPETKFIYKVMDTHTLSKTKPRNIGHIIQGQGHPYHLQYIPSLNTKVILYKVTDTHTLSKTKPKNRGDIRPIRIQGHGYPCYPHQYKAWKQRWHYRRSWTPIVPYSVQYQTWKQRAILYKVMDTHTRFKFLWIHNLEKK